MKTAAVVLILATLLFAKTQVILSDSSTVSTDVVSLGQIAQISGEHKNLLDTLTVSIAALAGFSRFLLKNNIIIPAEIKNSTTLTGPDRIKIYSLSQKVSYETLAKIAGGLLENLIENSEYVKSEIIFEYPKDASVNVALGDYEVVLGKIDAERLKGRTQIPLLIVQRRLSSNDEKRTRVFINARIKTVARVCVATKDMTRSEKFLPQHLEYKEVDISTLQGTPLFEMPTQADEYLIVGAVRKGAVITDRHIKPKAVIEAGTPVKMTAAGGAVRVHVWGRARSAGGIGDIIAIENLESNKIVKGKIIGPAEVQIVRGGTI